jgi:hypothetical protein
VHATVRRVKSQNPETEGGWKRNFGSASSAERFAEAENRGGGADSRGRRSPWHPVSSHPVSSGQEARSTYSRISAYRGVSDAISQEVGVIVWVVAKSS